MADIPSPLTWGTIVGNFGALNADSSDAGLAPDLETVSGQVTITPRVPLVKILDPAVPMLAVNKTTQCNIVNGVLIGPDGQPGVRVVATDSPGIEPFPLQWDVRITITGATTQPPPQTINVPGGGTVNLAVVIPAAPSPPIVTVVSDQTKLDAIAARNAAQLAETNAKTSETNSKASETASKTAQTAAETARTAAQTARTGAETARTGAQTAETNAKAAQTAAETARTGAQTAQTASEGARDTALGYRNTASTHASNASASASAAAGSATAAATSAANAKASETAVSGSIDTQVDAGIVRALASDKIVSPVSLYDINFEYVPNPLTMSGPAGVKQTVPTHVTPSGGETTHPSVFFAEDGWNGYRYWMAHTPYPAGNDDHEDPNIVASNDGVTWVVPSGLTNPLDDQDGQPEYNSDVDLRLGPDNALYLFWRFYDSTAVGQEENIYYRKSTNGTTWTAKTLVMRNNQATRRLLSPSFLFRDGIWWMWAVDMATNPSRVVLLKNTSADPAVGWGAPVTVNVGAMQSGKQPWHLSIHEFGGRFVGLLADCDLGASGSNGDLLFISSTTGSPTTNGTVFTNSGKSVIPRTGGTGATHNALYRATMVPAIKDGVFGYKVWYSAWMNTTPSVWNIFQTFITDFTGAAQKKRAYGQFTASIAASGSSSNPQTFPEGLFSTAPHVNLTTDSGRINTAAASITATGFNYNINNWTTAAANGINCYWEAVER